MLESSTLTQLEEFFSRWSQNSPVREKFILLSTKVSMNPTLQLEKGWELNHFRFKGHLKLKEKLILGVILWYLPDEIRVLGQLELERIWGGERKEWLAMLINSKLLALGLLLEQDAYNDNDLWGNLLTESFLSRILLRFPVDLKKKRSRAQLPQRRRGHRDSGGERKIYLGPNRIDFNKLKTPLQLEKERILLEIRISDFREQIERRIVQERYKTKKRKTN